MKITYRWMKEQCENCIIMQHFSGENLKKIFKSRKSLTPLELINVRSISISDKIILVTRPGVLKRKQQSAWCIKTIGRVIRKYALHCEIPGVEQWAEKWLRGEDRSMKAGLEAEFVASESTNTSKWSACAVMTAAQEAAEKSTFWALHLAVEAKVRSMKPNKALRSAARIAAERKQISDLRKILRS